MNQACGLILGFTLYNEFGDAIPCWREPLPSPEQPPGHKPGALE